MEHLNRLWNTCYHTLLSPYTVDACDTMLVLLVLMVCQHASDMCVLVLQAFLWYVFAGVVGLPTFLCFVIAGLQTLSLYLCGVLTLANVCWRGPICADVGQFVLMLANLGWRGLHCANMVNSCWHWSIWDWCCAGNALDVDVTCIPTMWNTDHSWWRHSAFVRSTDCCDENRLNLHWDVCLHGYTIACLHGFVVAWGFDYCVVIVLWSMPCAALF